MGLGSTSSVYFPTKMRRHRGGFLNGRGCSTLEDKVEVIGRMFMEQKFDALVSTE